MKTTSYEHGTAFEETFAVTLRGEVDGQPCGWGCASHEKKWLEDQLHAIVKEAVARYYQCRLYGTSIQVTVADSLATGLATGKGDSKVISGDITLPLANGGSDC